MKISAIGFSLAGDKYLGRSYEEMDCQTFVEKCMADVGYRRDLGGSNSWYRECRSHGWAGSPEECVKEFGSVPKGALLFILEPAGPKTPGKFRDDGVGDATHMGIVTGRGDGAIHPRLDYLSFRRRTPLRHDFLPESCVGPAAGGAEPGDDRIGMGVSGTEARYGFLYETGAGGNCLGAGRFFRRRRTDCSARRCDYVPVTFPNIDELLFLPVALGYWKQHELWDGTYTLDDLLDIAELAEVRRENEERAAEAARE